MALKEFQKEIIEKILKREITDIITFIEHFLLNGFRNKENFQKIDNETIQISIPIEEMEAIEKTLDFYDILENLENLGLIKTTVNEKFGYGSKKIYVYCPFLSDKLSSLLTNYVSRTIFPYSEKLRRYIQANGGTMKVFISHSSVDKIVAEKFIELLRAAFVLPSKDIRCTSVDGYKLSAGVNSDNQLRQEIFEAQVFVALLSPNSINSVYVMFELGARWGAELYFAPIMVAGISPSNLKAPLSSINVISGTSETDLHQLIDELSKQLNIAHHESPAVYGKTLSAFAEVSKRTLPFIQNEKNDKYQLQFGVYWDKDNNTHCLSCQGNLKNSSQGPSIFYCSNCNNKFVLRDDNGKELTKNEAITLIKNISGQVERNDFTKKPTEKDNEIARLKNRIKELERNENIPCFNPTPYRSEDLRNFFEKSTFGLKFKNYGGQARKLKLESETVPQNTELSFPKSEEKIVNPQKEITIQKKGGAVKRDNIFTCNLQFEDRIGNIYYQKININKEKIDVDNPIIK